MARGRRKLSRKPLRVLLMAAALVWFFDAFLASPKVIDEGKFFSAHEVTVANKAIARINQTLGLSVVVETYDSFKQIEAKYPEASHTIPKPYNYLYALTQAQNGKYHFRFVHLVLWRHPTTFIVDVAPLTRETSDFLEQDRAALEKQMREGLARGLTDADLNGWLSFIARTVNRRRKQRGLFLSGSIPTGLWRID